MKNGEKTDNSVHLLKNGIRCEVLDFLVVDLELAKFQKVQQESRIKNENEQTFFSKKFPKHFIQNLVQIL